MGRLYFRLSQIVIYMCVVLFGSLLAYSLFFFMFCSCFCEFPYELAVVRAWRDMLLCLTNVMEMKFESDVITNMNKLYM